MTNTPSPDEDRELIGAVRNIAKSMKHDADEDWLDSAADRLESLLSDRAKLEEAWAAMRWVYENGMRPDHSRPRSVSAAFSDAFEPIRALNRSTDRAT